MKKLFLFLAALITIHADILAQEDDAKDSTSQSSLIQNRPITVWGYVDLYYAYNFNKPSDRVIGEMVNGKSAIYSHNRHNEFNLNNGIVGLRYNKDKVRAALSLQSGTYVVYNYATEPDVLKNIFEAYAGYQLTKKIWIDAGTFISHIGPESALSFDNLTLSRSMMADNTPYYETGVKLTFEATSKLTLTGLLLNGWQNIYDRNQNKAIGTQLHLKPNNNVLINWSTFLGKEVAAYENIPPTGYTDSLSTLRFFNNFFIQSTIKKNITLLAAFDIGIQEKRTGNGSYIWYNPNLIAKYMISKKISIAGRVEYYQDKNGVIIYSGTPQGFQTYSGSLNLDYKLADAILWRLEGKAFKSKNEVYIKDGTSSDNSLLILSSLAAKF